MRSTSRQRPQSLVSTIARNSLANVAVPIAAILTGPLLARSLGPSERGALAAIITPLAFVTVLGALGMPEAIIYAVARRTAPTRDILRIGLIIGFATGVVTGIAMFFLAPTILRNSPGYIGLMRTLCALLPIAMAMGAVRAIAQGLGRFDLANAERWLSVFTRVPLLFAAAFTGLLTVGSAAWITHGTGVLAMMVLWLVLRDRSHHVPPTDGLGRRLLNFGAQTWVGTIAAVLIMRLDQTLLAPLVGPAQLGFYAVAVSLAEVPNTLLAAVRDVMFSTATSRQDPHLIARACRVLVLLMAGFAVVGAALAPLALPLVFGADFSPAVRMAQVLFLSGVFAAVYSVIGVGLLSLGMPRERSVVQFVGLVVNVGLLFALVGPLQATGAAWATVATYVVMAALALRAFSRLASIDARDCVVPRRADIGFLAGLPAKVLRRAG